MNSEGFMTNLIVKTQNLQCTDVVPQLTTNSQDTNIENHILLVGKLITNKNFSANTLKAVLTKTWRMQRDVKVLVRGNNIFIFIVEHEIDIKVMLHYRPLVGVESNKNKSCSFQQL